MIELLRRKEPGFRDMILCCFDYTITLLKHVTPNDLFSCYELHSATKSIINAKSNNSKTLLNIQQ